MPPRQVEGKHKQGIYHDSDNISKLWACEDCVPRESTPSEVVKEIGNIRIE